MDEGELGKTSDLLEHFANSITIENDFLNDDVVIFIYFQNVQEARHVFLLQKKFLRSMIFKKAKT